SWRRTWSSPASRGRRSPWSGSVRRWPMRGPDPTDRAPDTPPSAGPPEAADAVARAGAPDRVASPDLVESPDQVGSPEQSEARELAEWRGLATATIADCLGRHNLVSARVRLLSGDGVI